MSRWGRRTLNEGVVEDVDPVADVGVPVVVRIRGVVADRRRSAGEGVVQVIDCIRDVDVAIHRHVAADEVRLGGDPEHSSRHLVGRDRLHVDDEHIVDWRISETIDEFERKNRQQPN